MTKDAYHFCKTWPQFVKWALINSLWIEKLGTFCVRYKSRKKLFSLCGELPLTEVFQSHRLQNVIHTLYIDTYMSHGQHCDKKYSKTFELPDLLNFRTVIIDSPINSKYYILNNHLKSKKFVYSRVV